MGVFELAVGLGSLVAACAVAALIIWLGFKRAHGADPHSNLLEARLVDLQRMVANLGATVQSSDANISAQLRLYGEQTAAAAESAEALRSTLANPRARGSWGERLAGDILRNAGFTEGVSYLRQTTIENGSGRPDFIFPLPGGQSLNMDVKFPLDNYSSMLGASGDSERESYRKAFLRDVRARLGEITTREYIDPEGGTVDCVLLFIPNESVYGFIHEQDPAFLDDALRQRVVCCSPLTLFAVLAVVRHAVESFAIKQASDEVLALLGRFTSEWEKFGQAADVLGRRLNSAENAFEELIGPRWRALERPLTRIDALRKEIHQSEISGELDR